MKAYVICALAAFVNAGVPEVVLAQQPLIDYETRFFPTIGSRGMVSGPERLASEIGLEMLAKGGNAIDAAVATGFALAVTLPRAGNLAGGGFMLIHLAKDQRDIFIDYREMAPQKATRDMYLNFDGTVNKSIAWESHSAAGVPGTVAGLLYALQNYGSLDLATVIQPAINLAKLGFKIPASLYLNLRSASEKLSRNAEANRVYLQGKGEPPPIGSVFKQEDLGRTLERIRDNGSDGFYKGKTAELIAEDMAANQGLITVKDLAVYSPIERAPIVGDFKGYSIVSAPPPSSGGIHIIQMLKLLEPYPLKLLGHNSAAYLHLLIEVMRLAYADRSEHLGDPDRSAIPAEMLISQEYLDSRRKLIQADQASSSAQIKPGIAIPFESSDTTHFSVADAEGNVVSNTYTLNFSFGSGIVVPGTGLLLNNEMDDFAARPGFPNAFGLVQGERNAIEAGRRPLSSMTPTIVKKQGKPWLITGSPGGSFIITAVLQNVLNAIVFGMHLGEATSAPRVHHQWMPDRAILEPGISPDTSNLLEVMGHNIYRSEGTIGRTNSIRLEGGWMYGFSDQRRPGGHVATR